MWNSEQGIEKELEDLCKHPQRNQKMRPDMLVADQLATKIVCLMQDVGDLMDAEFVTYWKDSKTVCMDCGRYFQAIETWECMESSLENKVFFVGGDYQNEGIIVAISFNEELSVKASKPITSKNSQCRVIKAIRRIKGTDTIVAAGNEGIHILSYQKGQFDSLNHFAIEGMGSIVSIQVSSNYIYLMNNDSTIFLRACDASLPMVELLKKEAESSNLDNSSQTTSIAMNIGGMIESKYFRDRTDSQGQSQTSEGVDLSKLMASQSSSDIQSAMKQSSIMNLSPHAGLPSSMVQSMMADDELFKNNLVQATIKKIDLNRNTKSCLFICSNDNDLVVATDKGFFDLVLDKVQGFSKSDFHEVGPVQAIFEGDSQLFLQQLKDHSLHLYSKMGQRVMKKMSGSDKFDSVKLSPIFKVKQSIEMPDMLLWYAGGMDCRLVDTDSLEVTPLPELLAFADSSTLLLNQMITMSRPKKILALVTAGKRCTISCYDLVKKKERTFDIGTISDEKKTKKADGRHQSSSGKRVLHRGIQSNELFLFGLQEQSRLEDASADCAVEDGGSRTGRSRYFHCKQYWPCRLEHYFLHAVPTDAF